MTEIKFSGADVDRCVSALMGNAYLGELDGDDLEEVVQIVLSALVASGWRREQDVHAGHVIEVREDGWTIMHPLVCRPNLFDCPVNRVAELTRPDALGRFECELNDTGDRLLIGCSLSEI
jgi:hypothetical protein